MSNIDKQALREVAEKATPGRWEYYPGNTSIEYNVDSMDEDQGSIVYVDSGDFTQKQTDLNGAFIAASNPTTVLALLDELEASYSRIGELEVIATDYGIKFQKAQDAMKHQSLLHKSQMEAAEKRIAELEAREVVLPSTQDVHPLGPQSAKIFCEFHRSIVNRCADEIRKVGVKVSIKGN
ncbi:ead/Ea22-like family protein [Enterobacter hormaechei]|uniref:ead/Ea22-like family protein n=1 Tax=Enterobacter hormaechei TaxID=158836 RepID=UPI000F82ABC8|nr:ead/Ea22-like family protein [Enterobacter hormaechei]RTP54991.1 ead/Ea22-like family protein [Enterobacter hormaechei]